MRIILLIILILLLIGALPTWPYSHRLGLLSEWWAWVNADYRFDSGSDGKVLNRQEHTYLVVLERLQVVSAGETSPTKTAGSFENHGLGGAVPFSLGKLNAITEPAEFVEQSFLRF
jgi:hypothetical protein